jgi:hypothetical protein
MQEILCIFVFTLVLMRELGTRAGVVSWERVPCSGVVMLVRGSQ